MGARFKSLVRDPIVQLVRDFINVTQQMLSNDIIIAAELYDYQVFDGHGLVMAHV